MQGPVASGRLPTSIVTMICSVPLPN
jgi:hypothetical protein